MWPSLSERRWFVAGLAALLVMLGLPRSASAEAAWTAASEWVTGNGSRLRLIGAGLKAGDGGTRLVAGVEIALDDGWKTYWRSPGDSGGIPPTFDWDQSAGIAKAELFYPAPRRFQDPEGVSAGYKHHVVFPIEVTAEGSSVPELKLGAFYGICREICVPAEAEATLSLAAGSAVDPQIVAALEAALAAVPRPLADGALPMIETVTLTKTGEGGTLVVEARFDPTATERSLFVEAANGAYLPIPSGPQEGGDKATRFEVKLKSREADDIAGETLILTLVSDKGAAEVRRKAD
jgi:DsbC/DsbD-like thiol-disulfide interchange protein